MIYSQSYLMSLGLGVTWDNPDVQLQRNGVIVSSSQIHPDSDYEIVARIWNGSNNAPVAGLPVEFSFIDFGMGGVTRLIGTTQVDLGVKGGPECPTFATVPWHTPSTPGHYCLLVTLSWIDDANPLNNVGQENLTIGQAHSPAEFSFTLRNDTRERQLFTFEVDSYEIPELPPCEEVLRPSLRDLQRRSVAPAGARVIPTLPASVRERHDRSAYPVPEGWTVAFDPTEAGLAAGEAQMVRVSVEPGPTFRGTRRINVRAVAGQRPTGGVTLVIEKS